MPEEMLSYSEDAIADMKAAQARQDKLDAQVRDDRLAVDKRKHDIHIKRLDNFKCAITWFFSILIALIVISVLGYLIHGSAVKHYQKEHDNNIIWNAQCEAAGGQVVFNDIGTDYDNVCYFGSGFSVPRGTVGS